MFSRRGPSSAHRSSPESWGCWWRHNRGCSRCRRNRQRWIWLFRRRNVPWSRYRHHPRLHVKQSSGPLHLDLIQSVRALSCRRSDRRCVPYRRGTRWKFRASPLDTQQLCKKTIRSAIQYHQHLDYNKRTHRSQSSSWQNQRAPWSFRRSRSPARWESRGSCTCSWCRLGNWKDTAESWTPLSFCLHSGT